MTYVVHQGVFSRKFEAPDEQSAKDMARQSYINKAGPRFATLVEMDGDLAMTRAWMLEDPGDPDARWWVYSDVQPNV